VPIHAELWRSANGAPVEFSLQCNQSSYLKKKHTEHREQSIYKGIQALDEMESEGVMLRELPTRLYPSGERVVLAR